MKTVCKCFCLCLVPFDEYYDVYIILFLCVCVSLAFPRTDHLKIWMYLFFCLSFQFKVVSFTQKSFVCVCISENRRNKFKKWIAIRMCEIYFQSKNRGFFHWFKKILLGQKVSNTVIAKSFTHDLLDAFMIHSFEGCLTNRYGWENTWRAHGTPAIWKGKMNDCAYT